jgi:hypothetical protein
VVRRDGRARHEGQRGTLWMRKEARAAMLLECPQFGSPVAAPSSRNNADDPLQTGFDGGDAGVSGPSILILISLRGCCR